MKSRNACRRCGFKSAMGMETLNSAARAAGFAMATTDDTARSNAEAEAQPSWQSREAVLPAGPKTTALVNWLKSLPALFGRGAPA